MSSLSFKINQLHMVFLHTKTELDFLSKNELFTLFLNIYKKS